MKKVFEKALKAKQAQRQRNAAASATEKFRTLDRLHERSKRLKSGKLAKA